MSPRPFLMSNPPSFHFSQVRAVLLSSSSPLSPFKQPFSSRILFLLHCLGNTILVGHSLENDLRALQLFHPFIIDTSMLYTRDGGDGKRKHALRYLASKYLNVAIQNDSTGHCSAQGFYRRFFSFDTLP
jgi:RNA exonuclease 1